jgi:hypothetical protein
MRAVWTAIAFFSLAHQEENDKRHDDQDKRDNKMLSESGTAA